MKAEQVASFLGKKITPVLAQEIGSRFATRIEGTRIKHRFGKTGVEMYDEFGRVLRLETTTNDVSFFNHHRKVEHDDGPRTRELAPLKKSIYSLIDLRQILAGCNRRYLEFLSALEDTFSGERDLGKLTKVQYEGERRIKGLNFFERTEQALLRALQRPELNIQGLRRADVKPFVPLTGSALSRQLHRLRALVPDQARHTLLPLLPYAPRPRRHRRRLLADAVQHRARYSPCKMTNSSPILSTLNS